MKLLPLLIILLARHIPVAAQGVIFKTENGKVQFHSDARLEIIKANSQKLRGLLNPETRNFAFVVPVTSFEGFNAALQKEHFNENYMESDRFPLASFSGKIIEEISFLTPGNVTVRAKGILSIHGLDQDRIIKVNMQIRDGSIGITSVFSVLLKDHEINLPKIVHEKVASEINVEVQAELKKQ